MATGGVPALLPLLPLVFADGGAGGCSIATDGVGWTGVGGSVASFSLGLSGPIVESGEPGSIGGSGDFCGGGDGESESRPLMSSSGTTGRSDSRALEGLEGEALLLLAFAVALVPRFFALACFLRLA